jgi:hypothetical protein
MQVSKAKILTMTLAAVLVAATLDDAAARHRRHSRATSTSHKIVRSTSPEAAFWGNLVPVENGTPIIMKGFHPSKAAPGDAQPRQHAGRPLKIPRGSSTYIPPPVPSPYSANSPPAPALTQPTVQPYNPPPITTFSDRVNSAIQAYPLEKGLGNNPTDQQQFIRQRLNQ